ncbi:hypothetical protein BCEN4_740055 [Burkholderia cenocepacia]|uniref:hypothetical protein n=1 Tax=Burkholderia cenocepacia TaxID=95486 RepID=UPI00192B08A8|nr:hypothetical protein [Burkholderia cenocepacia]CAD9227918.1 hypothetical protein BCEN4_740055 [Burkholderia cenocepacia]
MNRELKQEKDQQTKKEAFKKIVKDMEDNPHCTIEGAYKLAVKHYGHLITKQGDLL